MADVIARVCDARGCGTLRPPEWQWFYTSQGGHACSTLCLWMVQEQEKRRRLEVGHHG